MADLGTLSARITADTSGFDVGGALGALGKLSAAAAAAGAAITAKLGTEAVQATTRLGDAVRQAAAKAGQTEQVFNKFRDAAVEAGRASTFSATEAGDALKFLAQAGLSAQQATATLPKTLQLAEAGSLALADAADITTNVMQGFSLKVKELGRVNDTLAKVAADANTSVQGIGDAMSFAAPVANALGVSLEQTAAAIGTFADAGIKGQRAGRTFRAILQQLRDPPKQLKKEFERLGVSLRTASGDMRPLQSIIRQLQNSARQGASAIGSMSNVASTGMQVLVDRGAPALQQFTSEIDGATGEARKMAEFMRKSLRSQMDILAGSVSTLGARLGREMTPEISKTVRALTTMSNQMSQSGTLATRISQLWDTAFSGMLTVMPTLVESTGLLVTTLSAGLEPVIRGVVSAMSGLVGTIQTGIGVVASWTGHQQVAQRAMKKAQSAFETSSSSLSNLHGVTNVAAEATRGASDATRELVGRIRGMPGATSSASSATKDLAGSYDKLQEKVDQTNTSMAQQIKLQNKLQRAELASVVQEKKRTAGQIKSVRKGLEKLRSLDQQRAQLRERIGGKTQAELAAAIEMRRQLGKSTDELESQLASLNSINAQRDQIIDNVGTEQQLESELTRLQQKREGLETAIKQKKGQGVQLSKKQASSQQQAAAAANQRASAQTKAASQAKKSADQTARVARQLSKLETLGAALGGPLGQQAAAALPTGELQQFGGDTKKAQQITKQARKRTAMLKRQSQVEKLRLKRKRKIAKIEQLGITRAQKDKAIAAVRKKFAVQIAQAKRRQQSAQKKQTRTLKDTTGAVNKIASATTRTTGQILSAAGASRQLQSAFQDTAQAAQGVVSAVGQFASGSLIGGITSGIDAIGSLISGLTGGRGQRRRAQAAQQQRDRKKFADMLAERLGDVIDEKLEPGRDVNIDARGALVGSEQEVARKITDLTRRELQRLEGVGLG